MHLKAAFKLAITSVSIENICKIHIFGMESFGVNITPVGATICLFFLEETVIASFLQQTLTLEKGKASAFDTWKLR
jgi:hypothetical protein